MKEPKSELHKDKYAPDQAVLGTSYQEALENRTLRREERRGQLRLSLTNTYHEGAEKRTAQGQIRSRSGGTGHVLSGSVGKSNAPSGGAARTTPFVLDKYLS